MPAWRGASLELVTIGATSDEYERATDESSESAGDSAGRGEARSGTGDVVAARRGAASSGIGEASPVRSMSSTVRGAVGEVGVGIVRTSEAEVESGSGVASIASSRTEAAMIAVVAVAVVVEVAVVVAIVVAVVVAVVIAVVVAVVVAVEVAVVAMLGGAAVLEPDVSVETSIMVGACESAAMRESDLGFSGITSGSREVCCGASGRLEITFVRASAGESVSSQRRWAGELVLGGAGTRGGRGGAGNAATVAGESRASSLANSSTVAPLFAPAACVGARAFDFVRPFAPAVRAGGCVRAVATTAVRLRGGLRPAVRAGAGAGDVAVVALERGASISIAVRAVAFGESRGRARVASSVAVGPVGGAGGAIGRAPVTIWAHVGRKPSAAPGAVVA